MACNFLQLKNSQTEVIIFGPPSSVTSLSSSLGPLSNNVHSVVRNLGVMLDSSLHFNEQINSVVRRFFFYQLRVIDNLKSILSQNDLEIVIHAFITSRLDNCNILYSGLMFPQFPWNVLIQGNSE